MTGYKVYLEVIGKTEKKKRDEKEVSFNKHV